MYTYLRDSEPVASRGASCAWSRVAALASAVDASLDKWLTDNYRIGLSEYRALALLNQASDKELRIAILAQSVGLTSTSTTRLVSRLEAKDYAHRDVCTDDGRGVYAVINEAGEALLREAHAPYEDRVRALLSEPAKYFPHLDIAATSSAIREVNTLVTP